MAFVLILAGDFSMGSNAGDSFEKPVHRVHLSQPFYLGKYPVTQGQWQAVMGNNSSHFKGDADLPVESVSWEDAQEFLRCLRVKVGRTPASERSLLRRLFGPRRAPGEKLSYRLPTEAEWEYAARAGSTTAYGFGDDTSQLGAYAFREKTLFQFFSIPI